MQIDNLAHLTSRFRFSNRKADIDSTRLFRQGSTCAGWSGFLSLGFLCLGLLVCGSLQAQSGDLAPTLPDGGEVQIAVDGQGEVERSEAYRIGLRWLLQRYADRIGDTSIISSESTRKALRAPENLVDAFEYARIANRAAAGAVPVSPAVRDTGNASHLLTVQFSVPAVQALLSEADSGSAAQGDEQQNTGASALQRPATDALLWLLIQDDGQEAVVAGDTAKAVVLRLTELAGGIGWTVGFPSLDVTDIALVGPETLEAAVSSSASATLPERMQLRNAAARYRHPIVISGLVSRQSSGSWLARLLRMNILGKDDVGGASSSQQDTSGDLAELAAASLDESLQQVVAWIAGFVDSSGQALRQDGLGGPALSGFGRSPESGFGDGNSASIWFDGVMQASDYARIQTFLDDTDVLERAAMTQMQQAGVLFEIEPRAQLSSLSGALQSQPWLVLSERPAPSRQIVTESQPPESQTLTDLEALALDSDDSDDAKSVSDEQLPAPEKLEAPVRRERMIEVPEADLYLRVLP